MKGSDSGQSPQDQHLRNPELKKILYALDTISDMVSQIKEELAKSNIPTGDVEFKDGLLHRGNHGIEINGKIRTGLIRMLTNAVEAGVSTQKIKERFNLTQHQMHTHVYYLREKIGKLNLSIDYREENGDGSYVLVE